MKITRLTSSSSFLTLAEAKAHLRVDDSGNDAKITAFMEAAQGYLDGPRGVLGRSLGVASYQMQLSGFPTALRMSIPLPPAIGVDSIEYLDETGALVTFDAVNYRVTGLGTEEGAVVVLDPVSGVTWPAVTSGNAPDTVRVSFTAGYLGIDSPTEVQVPAQLREAALLMLSDWYETRTSSVVGTTAGEMPFGAMALIAPYRLYLAGC